MAGSVRLDDARLRAIRANLAPRAAQIVAGTAFEIEALAKVKAAVDTGAMRNSIQAAAVALLTWRVAVGVAYARFVEFGTSRMKAQPFLIPAVEQLRAKFISRMAELFK